MMPIVGFLPATDPRMRSTIDGIAERLTDEHGLVYRYRAADVLSSTGRRSDLPTTQKRQRQNREEEDRQQTSG